MTADLPGRLRRVQVWTTAIGLVTVAVILVVGAFGLLALFERAQVRQVDDTLDVYAGIARRSAAAESLPDGDIFAGTLFQIVNDEGAVVYATESLVAVPALRSVGDDPARPSNARIEGIGPVRVVAVPFVEGSWVLIAHPLQQVEDAVATLRTGLLISVPCLAALLGLVLWIVVGRTLQPVRVAMEREERLVADVSHELRTPLAGVRALLESESSIQAEIELNRLEALGVLGRLESIASGLLLAARHGRPDRERLRELVDLDEVVLRVVDLVPPPAGVELDASDVSGGQVLGSGEGLERLVANLVSNAVRHAATRVQVTVDEHDGFVTLAVSDDGPGIPAEDRDRIYERFTRLDNGRGRDSGGAGLGLSIVRAVVDAHGGTIVNRAAPSGGAEFVVTLPASVAPY